MIELTWLHMANPQFHQAINTIWDCPQMDAATSYSAHRIKQKIEKVDKEIRDLRMEICKKYGKKDESGKLINDERGYIVFDKPEDNKAFEEEFTKEFNHRKAQLKVSKIDFKNLAQVRGLPPRCWEFLAPIVDNLPVEEEDLPDDSTGGGNIEVPFTPKRKKRKTT